jgi:hypothetical protein
MCATAEPGRFQCCPARPGEGSSAARSARRSFPKEFIPDFSREILEKNPVILEKNPVSLYRIRYHIPMTRYSIRYCIRYRARCLIIQTSMAAHGGRLPALDRDAADVITGSGHTLCALRHIHPLEINMWMWRYGRTSPRQISVDQAVALRNKRAQESRARGAETLRRRHAEAWAKRPSTPQ